MRFQLDVAGQLREVSIRRQGTSHLVEIDGRRHLVDAAVTPDGRMSLRMVDTNRQHAVVVTHGSEPGLIDIGLRSARVPVRLRSTGAIGSSGAARGDGPERIAAPMPGKIVKLLVGPGDAVAARQGVVVVEAMKMENELRATRGGVVREVLVTEGASVEAGTLLLVIA